MPVKYQTDITLEDAKKEYLEKLIQNGMAPKIETISVAKAAGRTTASPVYAVVNAPHYSASAMDGVALAAKLTLGATKTMPVILSLNQYFSVDTGDPLPEGCDAVVMSENVAMSDDGSIAVFVAAEPWQHIRRIGEDICAHEMILPSFSKVTPYAIGAMIAGGVMELDVIKKPVVGFIPTGNELVPPALRANGSDVFEFNSAVFSAMLQEWGALPVSYPIVGDSAEKIHEALEIALLECDAVLLGVGSVSGSENYGAAAILRSGSVMHHGLSIKPGKSAILGLRGEKPIVGVPGYPVSGIIVVEQLVRPIVDFLNKAASEPYKYVDAVLSKTVASSEEHLEFIRVRMGYVKGRLIAAPLSRGSGIVTSFMKADGIVEVPQGIESYASGKKVSIRLLRSEADLRRSLVAIGSHDPMLDELSELMRRKFGDVSLISAHVGSMGGLLAVRRSEAHLAGTHLLDEKTGFYNSSFITKHFPKGGVRLVECVNRKQGFMLQKGNPLGVLDLSEITRDGIRYVNRQKGSGTRILLDYLCSKSGIDPSMIHGFSHEEFTHTSVAAIIASGAADVGLGIHSAAMLYGLDFLPVCDEQYDLLIPDHAWDIPLMQQLMEVLRSDEFRHRLEFMGGYEVGNPGAVRLRL